MVRSHPLTSNAARRRFSTVAFGSIFSALPLVGAMVGCGDAAQAPVPPEPRAERASPAPDPAPNVATPTNRARTTDRQHEGSAPAEAPAGSGKTTPGEPVVKPTPAPDAAALWAAGVRRLEGRHLTLYTDLPADAEVDRLTDVFDRAYAEWCAYFGVSAVVAPVWKMTGRLMVSRERFAAAGLLPPDLPKFLHGYSVGADLWIDEQPNDYYRRHLLLHEGTHGFMFTRLGGCGPPWYMEGVAELLATHHWDGDRLRLNYFPRSRDEVPDLGRIKIVREGYEAGQALSLLEVMNYGPQAHQRNEPYGWCWATAALLDGHPRYRDRFRGLVRQVNAPDFNRRMMAEFAVDWRDLTDQWWAFAAGLEYDYDFERAAIDFAPGEALAAEGATVSVLADRGWQSSGLRLEAGASYQLVAQGRYQVADQPQVWWCEPGGVSIRYYQGRPLGMLLAVVRPDEEDDSAPSAFVDPTVVGLGAVLSSETSGTLYLRINDSAAELDDNAGELEVRVEQR